MARSRRKAPVCQVDRGGCENILNEDTTRQDCGPVLLELSRNGVDQLLNEVREHSIPSSYDVLRIVDPDGNELLVCREIF